MISFQLASMPGVHIFGVVVRMRRIHRERGPDIFDRRDLPGDADPERQRKVERFCPQVGRDVAGSGADVAIGIIVELQVPSVERILVPKLEIDAPMVRPGISEMIQRADVDGETAGAFAPDGVTDVLRREADREPVGQVACVRESEGDGTCIPLPAVAVRGNRPCGRSPRGRASR